MAQPTAQEQYMLELVNRARRNPEAEAARYGLSLNQGLAAGTLTGAAKQPLVFNPNLINAARGHSQWMLDTDQFSHTGAGGSSAGDRMTQSGYAFTGSWTWGENIAWRGSTGNLDATATIAAQHEGLFNSPGHRRNLLNDNFREMGIGALTGDYGGYNALMTTQKFAKSGNSVFLTGVAYNDAVQDDDFYTVGEGLGGIQVEALRSDGQRFQTTTFASGGYQLALEPGSYTINFSGGSLGQTVQRSVTIAQQNIKLDLATDQLPPASGQGTPQPPTTAPLMPSEAVSPPNPQPDPQPETQPQAEPTWFNPITGTSGSDRLLGTNQADEILGVDVSAPQPGLNQRDILVGNAGGDRFVLGDRQRVYYDDGDNGTLGIGDFAYIADFEPGDQVQLHGFAADYRLDALRAGLSLLVHQAGGGRPEVIGVIQSQEPLALNSDAFTFV